MNTGLEPGPRLAALCRAVVERYPLHEPLLRELRAATGSDYLVFAEEFLGHVDRFLAVRGTTPAALADGYVELCGHVICETVRFKQAGAYRADGFAAVEREVYAAPAVMERYLHGILASLILWRSHYELLRYFLAVAAPLPAREWLEIGCGHGYHLARAIAARSDRRALAIDISLRSLDHTRAMLASFGIQPDRVAFTHGDITREPCSCRVAGYDLIHLGEVIEHLEQPLLLLAGLRDRLAPGGRVFLTTCANAPLRDHLFLFRTVDEIRALLVRAGYAIVSELVVPYGGKTLLDCLRDGDTVNYGCLLAPATEG